MGVAVGVGAVGVVVVVAVGSGVGVVVGAGAGVGSEVGVGNGVGLGVAVGVLVGACVAGGCGVGDGVGAGVTVGTGVAVGSGAAVGASVGVGVGVSPGAWVAAGGDPAVGSGVAAGAAVAVGVAATVAATAGEVCSPPQAARAITDDRHSSSNAEALPSPVSLPQINFMLTPSPATCCCAGFYGPVMVAVGALVSTRFPMAHGAPALPGGSPEPIIPAQVRLPGRTMTMSPSPSGRTWTVILSERRSFQGALMTVPRLPEKPSVSGGAPYRPCPEVCFTGHS